MCLPQFKAVCVISIIESEKSMTLYLYEHGRTPITYNIRRDENTKKFPKLAVKFWYNGGFGKDYYGCIAVPECQIDIAGVMSYDSDKDSINLEYEFDMNDYDNNDVIKNLNEITVRVYTQPDNFHGYVNSTYGTFWD